MTLAGLRPGEKLFEEKLMAEEGLKKTKNKLIHIGCPKTNAYIAGGIKDVGADIFQRGVCLPSDNKMTTEQQDRIIEVNMIV